jgi:hypothetical protein
MPTDQESANTRSIKITDSAVLFVLLRYLLDDCSRHSSALLVAYVAVVAEI